MIDIHTTDIDARASTGAEAIAELLGDPLPPDWRDPAAIEARQDHLSAVASIVGEVALDALAGMAELREQRMPLTADTPAVNVLACELVALDRAMRDYTCTTQRDGLGIVQDALEHSAGAAVAAMVTGMIERLRRELRAAI